MCGVQRWQQLRRRKPHTDSSPHHPCASVDEFTPARTCGKCVPSPSKAKVQAGRWGKIRAALKKPPPGPRCDLLRLAEDRPLVHCEDLTVPHEPPPIDHYTLNVGRLPLMHEAGDGAKPWREVRPLHVDNDEIGFLPGLERATVDPAERLVAVGGSPADRK